MTVPEHPSVRTMLGSLNTKILMVAKQVYRGKCAVAPSVLPHRQQNEYMRELHQELAKCITKASQQGESGLTRPTTRGRIHSVTIPSHGPVHPQLDLEGWRWPSDLKKTPLCENQGWEGIPILGEGIGHGGIRPPLLIAQASASHPPLAPHDPLLPPSGSAAPWKTSTCDQDPMNPGAGCGQMMPLHQLRRNWRNKSGLMLKGSWVMIPHCPRLWPSSLVDGMAKEWYDAPSPSFPMSASSEGLQYHPTYTGGVKPKVPALPSTGQSLSWPWLRLKEEPDLISHPHRWIHAEMQKIIHPHWLKELKASGRLSMGIHLIMEGLSDSKTLQWAHWQAVPIRQPLAQHEALGGGIPHLGLADSIPWISCPMLRLPAQGTSGPWGRRRLWP